MGVEVRSDVVSFIDCQIIEVNVKFSAGQQAEIVKSEEGCWKGKRSTPSIQTLCGSEIHDTMTKRLMQRWLCSLLHNSTIVRTTRITYHTDSSSTLELGILGLQSDEPPSLRTKVATLARVGFQFQRDKQETKLR